MFKKVLKKVQSLVTKPNQVKMFNPDIEILSDDIFLVSYPKSGNTWLRFLIGNYLTDCNIGFKNIIDLIPELQTNPEQCANVKIRPRFIKSHSPYTSIYPRVIYIYRDGRDVAVSSYYHLQKYGEISLDTPFSVFFKTFLKEGIMGLGTWDEHVDRWLDSRRKNDFIALRYEDMLEDIEREFKKTLSFAGLYIDDEKVNKAIEASSFHEMRKNEAKDHEHYFGKYGFKNKQVHFVRKGIKGDWQNHFSKEDEELFMSLQGATLKKLGYV